MSEQYTGITKTLWLHMLAEGGYSTIGELAQVSDVGKKRIDGLLNQMVDRGFCQKYRNPERKNGTGYGVTPNCKVPSFVMLKDILSATATGG